MKKHLLIIMILLPFFAKAQEDTDLFDFSSVIIQGTAKSAAMGNAMGAVGSDFSSMAINPAGLGMFRKASFIYTLGINASGTNSPTWVKAAQTAHSGCRLTTSVSPGPKTSTTEP